MIVDPRDFQLLVDSHVEWEIDRERARYPIIARYHASLATRQLEPLVLRGNYWSHPSSADGKLAEARTNPGQERFALSQHQAYFD